MFTYGMTDELSAKVGVHSVERAADLFGLLSTPVRLRIILELRSGEKSVGELLAGVRGAAPHVAASDHDVQGWTGLVARREQGVQVYYRIANESVVSVCKIVCAQVTLNSDKRKALPVL
jgi:hypothetical protein